MTSHVHYLEYYLFTSTGVEADRTEQKQDKYQIGSAVGTETRRRQHRPLVRRQRKN